MRDENFRVAEIIRAGDFVASGSIYKVVGEDKSVAYLSSKKNIFD